jgi:hypothetical protein
MVASPEDKVLEEASKGIVKGSSYPDTYLAEVAK